MHRRIIFYTFLRMGKVILCSFSLSPFIIFIPSFCFAQIPKRYPWDSPWDLSTWWKQPPAPVFSAVLADMGRQPMPLFANVCKVCIHTREGAVFHSKAQCWCTCRMLRATPDCSVHATQPWALDHTLTCRYPVVSFSAQCRNHRNCVGRQHGLGEPNIMFLALLAFGGNLESECMGCTWRSPQGESCCSAEGTVGCSGFLPWPKSGTQ